MKGGVLLGQGTYGCIFSPPPKSCDPKPHEIAKVFNDPAALLDEWSISQKIAHIDPMQKYFIYPTAKCSVRLRELAHDPDVEQCAFLGASAPTPTNADQHKYGVLRMPRAGLSAYDMIRTGTIAPKDFIRAMLPVFEGVKLLIKNKLIHHDIKFDNILYYQPAKAFRLIDFGILIPMQDAFSPTKNPNMTRKYWLHPPEYRGLVHLFNKYRNNPWPLAPYVSDNELRDVFIENMEILKINFTKDKHLRGMILDNYNYCDYEREYMLWMRALTKCKTLTAAQTFLNKTADRIDIYCIGITIIFLLNFMNPKIDPITFKIIRNLASEMVHSDPRKRPNITSIITRIEAINA